MLGAGTDREQPLSKTLNPELLSFLWIGFFITFKSLQLKMSAKYPMSTWYLLKGHEFAITARELNLIPI